MSNILQYFPYPSFRKYQEIILQKLQDYIDSFDFFLLEAPTGFGKSVVGYALGKYLLGERGGLSHICVADKFLQEQYLRDFKDIALVKGRGNFECSLPMFSLDKYFQKGISREERITCDKAPCSVSKKFKCSHRPRTLFEGGVPVKDNHGVIYQWEQENPDGEWWEISRPFCPYWVQKDNAIRSDVTIHNYAYFLHEALYSKVFTKRFFGLFDEAHLVESILMNFVEERITRWLLRRVDNHFGEVVTTTIPEYSDVDSWLEWLSNIDSQFVDLLDKYGSSEQWSNELGSEDYNELSIRNLMENTIERISKLRNDMWDDPENWVWLREDRSVTFKPVTVAKYSGYLFDHVDKKLLMSATILDDEKLKEYLGITDDVKFLRLNKSTFPVENRPFIYSFVGKATFKTMDTYLPNLVEAIDNKFIPKKLENKGVIHCHTNRIAKYILENSKFKDIMVTNTGRTDMAREDIFQEFFDAEPPCVMVSPSMNLGVDLHDDRCRWQLIVKVPYPPLGDPQINKRVKMDQGWYLWQTVMSLIQTYGRGVRSETDWCETHILDGKFLDLSNRVHRWLPGWFREATRVMGE